MSNKIYKIYAAPALALSMLGLLYFTYLPKLIHNLPGVSLFWVGVIIVCTRFFDAIIDPAIGNFSDRLAGASRRAIFLKWSVWPLALTALVLLSPQVFWAQNYGHLVFFIFSTLFFLFWSLYSVPYEAWSVELEHDMLKRNKLYAWRDGAIVMGTLSIALFVEFLRYYGFNDFQQITIATLLSATVLLITTRILLSNLHESFCNPHRAIVNTHSWKLLKTNQPFLLLVAAFIVNGVGVAVPATLLLFYVEYILGGNYGGLYLVLYLCSALLGFIFWSQIKSGVSKKSAWIYATLINSGAFLFTVFLNTGDYIWFAVITVVSALGYAGTQIFPSSLQADIIDYEESLSGLRREGEFFGIWSVAKKLSAALGAGLSLPILELSGFKSGMELSELSRITLIYLYSGVPVIASFLALCFILKLPNQLVVNKLFVDKS